MNHNQAPCVSQRELSLQVLQAIRQISEARRYAAQLSGLHFGTAIGPRRTPLEVDSETIAQEVNQTLAAIGGIQAVVGDRHTGEHLRLMQWHGPDEETPGNHLWLAQQIDSHNFGEASLGLSGLIHDLQDDA